MSVVREDRRLWAMTCQAGIWHLSGFVQQPPASLFG